ncbi:52 kDa repressor of the inhibitor of the protein kinase-like [Mytilus edulis]|uniref:52 kDa repressor of the inhibitor of the protein kinase-like n=1 Tax=Mytilus edulis TaxID=6550 RepID=UPI0039F12B55
MYLIPETTYHITSGRAVVVVSALESVSLVKEALQDVRDNIGEFHAKWYSEILKMADDLDVTQSKPRICGRQTTRSNVPCESTEDYYKKTIAIPLLDHMLTEMNSRFGDLQIKASMGLQVIPTMISQSSTNDFEYFVVDLPSPSILEQEMHMWKLKWANESDPPSDINTALQNCNFIIFPNVHQILKICGTFTVTSCECERSISRLRLVKTYFRSTMSTSRLSSLIMMYAHRNMTVNPKEVVMQYARRNPRRIVLPDILVD